MNKKTHPHFGARAIGVYAILAGAFFVAVVLVTANIALASPTANPPGGSGVISVSGSNVGIGTTAPQAPVEVVKGATGLGGQIVIRNSTEGAGNYSGIGLTVAAATPGYIKGGIYYSNIAGGYGRGDMYFVQDSSADNTSATLSNAAMVIQNGGNVGIGTTAPGQKLEVNGSALIDGTLSSQAVIGTISASNVSAGTFGSGGGNFTFPAALTVTGNITSAGLCLGGTCDTTWPNNSQWTTSGSNIYYSGGYVGIGGAPAYPLDIYTTSAGAISTVEHLKNTNGAALTGTGIEMDGYYPGAVIRGYSVNPGAVVTGQFDVQVNNSSNVLTTDLTILGNGNVGIGTTAPGAKLSVNGFVGTAMSSVFQVSAGSLGTTAGNELVAASIGGASLNSSALSIRLEREAAGSDWTTSGMQLSYDVDNSPRAGAYIELSHSGNVGIGQTVPGYKLDVAGAATFEGNQIHNVGTPTVASDVATKSYVDSAFTTASGISGSGGANYVPLFTGASSLGNSVIYQTGGNVGIGTTAPSTALQVVGQITASNEGTGLNWTGSFGQQTTANAKQLLIGYNAGSNYAIIQTIHESVGWTDQSLSLEPTGGNVGIGQTAPAYKLDVSGTGNFTGTVNVGTPTAASNAATKSYVDSAVTSGVNGGIVGTAGYDAKFTGANTIGNGNIFESGSNVGIGTTLPSSKLFIADTIGETYNNTNSDLGDANVFIQSAYGSRTLGTGAALGFVVPANSDGSNLWDQGRILVTPDYTNNGDASGRMYLQTRGCNGTAGCWGWNNNLVLASTGNVGVDQTSPAYPLDVSGTGNFTGTVNVGTPTAASNAATKSYVDSAVSSGVNGGINGSTNYLSKFTGTNTVGNSLIYDNGTNVGVGVTNPGAKLQVNGNVQANNFYSSMLTFTPTAGATGWYRVAIGANSMGGTVYLSAGYDNENQLLEFNYSVRGYVSANNYVGDLQVERTMNYNSGPVSQIRIGTDGSSNVYLDIYINSATTPGAIALYGSNGALFLSSPAYSPSAPAYYQTDDLGIINNFGAMTSQNFYIGANAYAMGNVGIGTTVPGYKLDVQGTGNFTGTVNVGTPTAASNAATKSYVDSAVASGLTGGGSSGNFTTLNVTGNWNISGAAQGGLNLNGYNISGVNSLTVTKINATTIDPVYQIGDTKYATFAPSTIGVTEEAAGEGTLAKAGSDYEYAINFSKLAQGSDLWVWYQAVDFSKDTVNAIATPYGQFAEIYYTISGSTLTFHGNAPAQFSFNLTGKRFDWQKWPTQIIDQSAPAGFVLQVKN